MDVTDTLERTELQKQFSFSTKSKKTTKHFIIEEYLKVNVFIPINPSIRHNVLVQIL